MRTYSNFHNKSNYVLGTPVAGLINLYMEDALQNISNIVIACHDKLAQYYNNDSSYKTKEFVKDTLSRRNFKILDEVESTYHFTIFAKNKLN
jgi:hypothetical protein